MTKFCISCGKEIPAGRLEALPHTETCVKHSFEVKKIALVQGAGHLGSTKDYVLEIFDGRNADAIQLHEARRHRSFGKGCSSSDQRGSAYWNNKTKGLKEIGIWKPKFRVRIRSH